MSLGPGVLALGLLATSGFVGGFCITNGSGQYIGMLPKHHAESIAPNASEDAAAGIMAAGDGQTRHGGHRRRAVGGGGGGADSGSDDAGGGGGDGAAAESGGSGGGETGAAAGGGAAGAAGGEGSKVGGAPRQITGVEAGAFLGGNTVVEEGKPRRYVFFAPRGLRMDGNQRSFLARFWDRSKSTLCSPGSDGILVCHIIEVRTNGLGAQPTGTPIGEVRMDGTRWLPILSGNVEAFPDHLPFLDSKIADEKPERPAPRATATGKAAFAALLDHPAAVTSVTSVTSGRPASILTFAQDGGLLDIERPQDETDAAPVLKVTTGTWAFSKSLLCMDGAPMGTAQACFTVQVWGKTSLRLVPEGKGGAIRLDLLNETARPQYQAAQ